MTPAELSRTVLRSVRGAVEEGELAVTLPERVVVRVPPRRGEGDYASAVALQLAKDAGRPAREVAEILRRRLVGSAGIAGVHIAGPGFLNFVLEAGARAGVVGDVLAYGRSYGDAGGADHVELRVAGDVRAVVVGEALRRILPAGGAGTAPGGEDVRPVPVRVPAEEVFGRLGEDEGRWALLAAAGHDPVRLPGRPVQRESNPRFRVQYAYARTGALVRNAADLGFGAEAGDGGGDQGAALDELYGLLGEYPEAVRAAARHRAPDRLVRHLVATADTWFRCHDTYPPLPVGEQKPSAVHRARLALAEATGTVLANGLTLLGITAPEYV
ncbi:ArgS-related anticodon-binding protein NrtL [Streptomyces sp. MST-110588]|uniref:ArgS-related anticodon-binding protein NrtL n=1 Tax=Streptomyces sp. MST-110588 TaxID=2833628 RepID=UPI001F5C5DA3|nr:DALR anticodon-binding domain-containing protein [Streptomyces sp. MST-110588]UNO39938.1 hypothetical protein KGS77_10445 [Streptomyces sp. MST-110588]